MANIKRHSHKLLALACIGAACGLSGCNSAGDGFLTGGTLGALGGMAIGSTAGHMGQGAAIGAVLGAIGGAVIGDQNARAASYYNGGYYGGYYGGRPGGCDGQWVYVGGCGGAEWAWRPDRCCR